MNLPVVTEVQKSKVYVQQFSGYNNNLRNTPGEFADMKNMTLDNFPVITTRSGVEGLTNLGTKANGLFEYAPNTLMAVVDGKLITGITTDSSGHDTGVRLANNKKYFAQIGTRTVIMPDKIVFDTETGKVEEIEKSSSSKTSLMLETAVHLVMKAENCMLDGTTFEPVRSDTAPSDTTKFWYDTTIEMLKSYSESTKSWVIVDSPYMKLTPVLSSSTTSYEPSSSTLFLGNELLEAKRLINSFNELDTLTLALDENMIPYPYYNQSTWDNWNGFRSTVFADGTISISGLASESSSRTLNLQSNVASNWISLEPNTEYTLKGLPSDGGDNGFGLRVVVRADGTTQKTYTDSGRGIAFTTPDSTNVACLVSIFQVTQAGVSASTTFKPVLVSKNETDYVVFGKAKDAAIVQGFPKAEVYQFTLKRKCPDLTHICSINNRVWGVDNNLHEIYSCKLGDPLQWYNFAGLASDSFAFSLSSVNEVTGCSAYGNTCVFFCDDRLIKVYGTVPSNFQSVETKCDGVASGADRTIQVVENAMYYLSPIGVMLYDGSYPKLISSNFKPESFTDRIAVAGRDKTKYMLSLYFADGTPDGVYVYDVINRTWCVADDWKFVQCSKMNNSLVFLDTDADLIYLGNRDLEADDFGEDPTDIEWLCETGYLGLDTQQNKYISRLQMRVTFRGMMMVEVAYDEGAFKKVYKKNNSSLKSVTIPINVRRCSYFRLRLSGVGQAKLYDYGYTLGDGSYA